MKNRILQLEKKPLESLNNNHLTNEQNQGQQHNQNSHYLKTNLDEPSFLNRSNIGGNIEVLDFMKEEMRKQYNKLKESLRFSDDRYEILKKKVYREYRTRIVELLNGSKKDKMLISKI
jgi:hypothetical protein